MDFLFGNVQILKANFSFLRGTARPELVEGKQSQRIILPRSFLAIINGINFIAARPDLRGFQNLGGLSCRFVNIVIFGSTLKRPSRFILANFSESNRLHISLLVKPWRSRHCRIGVCGVDSFLNLLNEILQWPNVHYSLFSSHWLKPNC